ncbi:MAG: EF2563 family selenium-dependent molybdenum hydroxylase system protein [Clostridium sp.]|uniref:selenium-dependent molybdenum cofactor biosynthesis protein YqeB n=1 Tax=Clostridium sp. TaxID=1506 RepID=UPI0025C4BAEE|nr:selenium-dependent molybdenum cofactor biosynthesis protein YqeB [Clostridium sp.]MCE5219892.1 EF2563 family selenium-dependent molybdenum hydroxylase system protein [Clostridium sp.]
MIALIKGAGDLATGVAYRLKKCGFNIVMTEISEPTTVRRTVAFSQAVYDNNAEVEGIKATLVSETEEAKKVIKQGNVAVIVDEKAEILKDLKPDVVVDAIIAKENLGTNINDASIVVALGPGFTAGVDCHCVIETQRGHYLGKAIYSGSAIPNSGVPGEIGGYTEERIIRATNDGKILPVSKIGDYVEKGDIVAYVNGIPIFAEIDGIVRGMLQKDVNVFKGMKSGDIDPRCEKNHCFTISDKARSIGGGVLEAILYLNSMLK